ncbi:hypothetical protein BDQ12DRAFT_370799 [Crucibulum laeve]|uniref:Uncharacterized protein n=1 Tax=Crucibulum laeve TaxID=68775 RepID=A0A5C3LQ09_9AGAR|nr:hypothetical protein BDQ12DRAFT_370799 [Crucibulum laeve]
MIFLTSTFHPTQAWRWISKLRSWTCTASIRSMFMLLFIFVVHGPVVGRNGHEIIITGLLGLNYSRTNIFGG